MSSNRKKQSMILFPLPLRSLSSLTRIMFASDGDVLYRRDVATTKVYEWLSN
jgi:hypothetical protein